MSAQTLDDVEIHANDVAARCKALMDDLDAMQRRCRFLKLELNTKMLLAEHAEPTAIYFPRVKMTRTQRVVRWIKKAVR